MYTLSYSGLLQDVQQSLLERGHPYRQACLATVSLQNKPRNRTVVLREVNSDFTVSFFTDERSVKVSQIKANSNVSLLLYNPKELIQIRIEGVAKISADINRTKEKWENVAPIFRKDYTTETAPGSSLVKQEEVKYLTSKNHFCIIDIFPSTIEWMKIDAAGHKKILFSKNEDCWIKENLVP